MNSRAETMDQVISNQLLRKVFNMLKKEMDVSKMIRMVIWGWVMSDAKILSLNEKKRFWIENFQNLFEF